MHLSSFFFFRIKDGEIRCISRGDLVVALASKLPPGTIRYGSHVHHILPDPDCLHGGGTILELSDGTSMNAKVNVAAANNFMKSCSYLSVGENSYDEIDVQHRS